MIPKKKYRDKVRERLAKVKELLKDRDRVSDMLMRIVGSKLEPKEKLEWSGKVELIWTLFDKDLPALLDALDEIAKQPKERT